MIKLYYKEKRIAPGIYDDIPEITFNKQHKIAVNLMEALVWKTGENHFWPVDGDRAAIAVEGAVIAALCGKYIIPYDNFFAVIGDKEYFNDIWEVFWQAYEANQEKLDRRFVAAMLYLFQPIEEAVDIRERAYTTVKFATIWGFGLTGHRYPDSMFNRTCHVRKDVLNRGKKIHKALPREIQLPVNLTAIHIPQMLETVIAIK